MDKKILGYILDFNIPQGPTGATGETGPTGPTGSMSTAYGKFELGGDKSYDMVRFGQHIIELNSYNYLKNIEFNIDNDNSVTIKERGNYLVLFKVPVSLMSGNSIIIAVGVGTNASLYTQKTVSQADNTVYFYGFDISYYAANTKISLYLQTSDVSTVKVESGAKLIMIKL